MGYSQVNKVLGQVFGPIIIVIALILLYKFGSKALQAFKERNVGKSAGAGDFSNLAYDIYSTYGFGYDRDETESVAARILALNNDQIMDLNDKFVALYGDKCPGGGVFCTDTTSLKTYVSGVWCLYGCKNQEALVSRLNALSL